MLIQKNSPQPPRRVEGNVNDGLLTLGITEGMIAPSIRLYSSYFLFEQTFNLKELPPTMSGND
jgi:hypothetical protein